jgi:Ca-activated chloride channel homolog
MTRTLAKIVLAAVLPLAALGQKAPQSLKVDVDLVSVNIRVTDSQGRTVVGLEPKDFELFEDRIEQKIEYFSVEEVPASIGIVFDISSSMAPVFHAAREAATDLLRLGTTQDEFFLITFNDRPQVVVDYTRDVSRLRDVLLATSSKGSTALWDAMYLGVEKLRRAQNPRRALISVTDGDENNSRYTARDFAELMREQDVQIFYLDTDTAKKLDGEKIATSLKTQYLIGYRSTNEMRDGKWRSIRVRVKTPPGMLPLNAKARDGYYAPNQ